MADIFPPLGRPPEFMQVWRPRARRYYQHQEDVWMKYYLRLKEQVKEGSAPTCFVKRWIEEAEADKQGTSDVQAAFLAGSTYYPS